MGSGCLVIPSSFWILEGRNYSGGKAWKKALSPECCAVCGVDTGEVG